MVLTFVSYQSFNPHVLQENIIFFTAESHVNYMLVANDFFNKIVNNSLCNQGQHDFKLYMSAANDDYRSSHRYQTGFMQKTKLLLCQRFLKICL